MKTPCLRFVADILPLVRALERDRMYWTQVR